ncbi:MAG TPA: hypothetical protein VMF91_25825 [Bryobacteraceae bacterium]|nr:hypothetical protein [Bryobacteraceae bacterium]
MTRRQELTNAENLRGSWTVTQYGFDVTDNVQLRIKGSKDQIVLKTPELEKAVARKALVSFRDEAIWQYRVRRVRGFLFWTTSHSIAYIPHAHGWEGLVRDAVRLTIRLCELLDTYQPDAEAIVWSEHEDGDELFTISADGLRENLLFATVGA